MNTTISESGTRRLRVLHLGSPTGLYGAERWILALVRHLPADQVESTVAVIRDDPALHAPLCTEAQERGVDAHVFESFGKVSLGAIGQIRQFVRSRGIDIIHTHGYKTDILGRLATVGTGCRTLSTPHGWSTKAGPKLMVYETLDRIAFLGFDAVAPLSEDIYDGLARIPLMKRRLNLIPNGVDITEVDMTSASDDFGQAGESATPMGENAPPLIGYVGQLIPRKGLDVLLKAFAALEHPQRRLLIIGDGPQREELIALTDALGERERVEFLGFRNDRLAIMKRCTMFVLPSRLEGIPRCVLEAMAAGVPVVSSDIPGSRDVVHDRRTGLLFPVDDVATLAECMRALAGDAALRASLAGAGRDFVRENYSAETMARRYVALYRSLTAG